MAGPKTTARRTTPKRVRFVGFDVLAAEPFRCANCFGNITVARLFCAQLCSDEASWVRYARRCQATGSDSRPDVAEALHIRLAHVLGGGYDKEGRRVSDETRKKVIARADGRCQSCGAPGEELDHIESSSDALSNLQWLCNACHNRKTVASFVPVTKASNPTAWAKARALRLRVAAPQPLQLCDQDDWDTIQRRLLSTRRAVHQRDAPRLF